MTELLASAILIVFAVIGATCVVLGLVGAAFWAYSVWSDNREEIDPMERQ